MADFEFAYNFMAPQEWNQRQHFSTDPADPGGATNYGITLTTLRGIGSLGDLNHDGVVDIKDLTAMSESDAKLFYKTRYWIWDALADDILAAKCFDIGVNLGAGTAVGYLQTALRTLGSDIAADCRLGPATLGAANAADPDDVLPALCRIQGTHYLNWVAASDARVKFKAGLLARAGDIPVKGRA